MPVLTELFSKKVDGKSVLGDVLLSAANRGTFDPSSSKLNESFLPDCGAAIPESVTESADPPAPAGLTREDVAALLDAAGERLADAVAKLPAPVVNVTVQAPEPKPQRAVFERGPDGRIESASLEPAD